MGRRKRESKEDNELFVLFKKFAKKMRNRSPSSIESESEADNGNEETMEVFQILEEPAEEEEPIKSVSEVSDQPASEVSLENPILDEDTLNILGDDPNQKIYASPIHKDITARWGHIVANGLQKETKTELQKMYQIPDNCLFLQAPKLNPEIKAAVSEQVLKRDKALELQQNSLGQATACIGRALNTIIKQKDCKEATKLISDAGRMLCDLFHGESQSRRYLLQFALNKNTKDIVSQTKVGAFIFGDNLHEHLKTGKAINKTGSEIKFNKPQPQPAKQKAALNFRGPPRKFHTQPPSAGRQNYRPRPAPQRRPAPQQRSGNGPPYRRN